MASEVFQKENTVTVEDTTPLTNLTSFYEDWVDGEAEWTQFFHHYYGAWRRVLKSPFFKKSFVKET